MPRVGGVPDQLLTTKLHIPPSRPEWVPRQRLIDRINASMDRKLTLISAPAGFGKTTLLAEWEAQCDRPISWVSLDHDDNDPVRFWSYAIGALQTIHPEIGQIPRQAGSAAASPVRPHLTVMINEIAHAASRFVLVLDDLHTVTAPQIHDDLTFLLDHLPTPMHLVVSSRSDPPWPLARLRARGEVTELRARDLRFTSEETAIFLNKSMKLDLVPEGIAALEERTEGWVAGLHMAALSLRERQDRTAFIESLRGTHRFVLDYLLEEVLNRQPTGIQDFLMHTSTLKYLTAGLCDAVTGRGDSDQVLARLERDNLFVIPLDDERHWYRYHHLFADLLRSRLRQVQPGEEYALHRRASVWYEEEALIVDAVCHALAAQDVDRAGTLIANNVLAMVYQGALSTVIGWLETLPEEMVRTRPWLRIARAWALVFSGQLDALEPALSHGVSVSDLSFSSSVAGETTVSGAVQDIAHGGTTEAREVDARRIAGHRAAICAYAAFLRWDRERGMLHARDALANLGQEDLAVRGLSATVLGLGHYGIGNLAASAEAFAEAISAGKAANDPHVAANALCELADLQVSQGQLHNAAATCKEALQITGASQRRGRQRMPISGYAYGRLSVVLREWNRLPEAIHCAQRCVELSQYWGHADTLILGYVFLSGSLVAAGRASDGLHVIQEARRIASDVSPRYTAFVAAKEARLRLATGDVAGARRWVQEGNLGAGDDPCRPVASYVTLARVLVAQASCHAGAGRLQPGSPDERVSQRPLDQALALLSRLLGVAEAAEADGHVIEILTVQAMTLNAEGDVNRALASLARALDLAGPEGYVRIFVDEGEPMARLLRESVARGLAADYAATLLHVLESELEDAESVASSALVEPLTERELEVLRLLTTHLSSTEIAETLYISANTVRSHIKNIYGKLGIHSRDDAVRRARDLGLL